MMTKDSCYLLTGVVGTLFQGNLQISTTASTVFEDIQQLENIKEDMTKIMETLLFIGEVQSCRIATAHKCVNCSNSLEHTSDIILKCQYCFSKQKETNHTKTLHLQVKSESKGVWKFVIFASSLDKFLTKNDLNMKTNDKIEDFLLMADQVSLKHDQTSDVAIRLQIKLAIIS